MFQRGSLSSSAWNNKLSNGGVGFDTDTRYQIQPTVTTNFSNGFKYNLNDHMLLIGDVQFVTFRELLVKARQETNFTFGPMYAGQSIALPCKQGRASCVVLYGFVVNEAMTVGL
ncbi:hypothetical protein [Dyella acidisoli]|uniref:TonB-dependent receptor n=1 Tax=Dyella acidisoli TaxID=1867834 RepID=A0ABQ5XJ18_9GAMM|nr:hypothetical protein [Dyella acidisoli]GLQ91627.1 hypothetical protein GCM10007901_05770 [Dyella acidisoli]